MTLIVGSARRDENGRYSGGKRGDQDGVEVSTQAYYMHSKGWYVLRPKDVNVANAIAAAMQQACDNDNIGYSQSDRIIMSMLKKYKTMAQIAEKANTDCSNLVRGCIYQATGIDVGEFYTGNEADVLEKSGLFEKRKAVTSSTELFNGDVLVTKTKGHTVIAVSGNPRSDTSESISKLGWIKSGDKWYYRIEEGKNAHGWCTIKNADGHKRWYSFDDKGIMRTGWQTISGNKYYLEESGDLEGALYRSDSSGAQSIWIVE